MQSKYEHVGTSHGYILKAQLNKHTLLLMLCAFSRDKNANNIDVYILNA